MAADIIAFANTKGGVLKTTTCVNLAALLAQQGKRVLIIDMDAQGNCATSFGKNAKAFDYTIFEVLLEDLDPSKAIVNLHENIDIIGADRAMENFQFKALTEKRRPYELLHNKIEQLRDQYDVILIDTPKSRDLIVCNALVVSNSVIIPFQPEAYSTSSLLETLEAIEEMKEEFNKDLKVLGVLTTLVDPRTNVHKAIIEDAHEYCESKGIEFFNTAITKTVKYADAIVFESVPAVLVDKGAKETFQDILNEITDRKGITI